MKMCVLNNTVLLHPAVLERDQDAFLPCLLLWNADNSLLYLYEHGGQTLSAVHTVDAMSADTTTSTSAASTLPAVDYIQIESTLALSRGPRATAERGCEQLHGIGVSPPTNELIFLGTWGTVSVAALVDNQLSRARQVCTLQDWHAASRHSPDSACTAASVFVHDRFVVVCSDTKQSIYDIACGNKVADIEASGVGRSHVRSVNP
jgi:hypothetical protein